PQQHRLKHGFPVAVPLDQCGGGKPGSLRRPREGQPLRTSLRDHCHQPVEHRLIGYGFRSCHGQYINVCSFINQQESSSWRKLSATSPPVSTVSLRLRTEISTGCSNMETPIWASMTIATSSSRSALSSWAARPMISWRKAMSL